MTDGFGKILIVDDERHIRELLYDNLMEEGYSVHMAEDGSAALNAFETCDPDLVILDIMMPGMDGWQVYKEIKRRKKRVKIIIFTAKNSRKDRFYGVEVMKAEKYISKPFDIEEIIGEINLIMKS